MANSRVRIDLPTNPEDKIKLAKAIVAKHAELGTASPLSQLKWDKITPILATADTEQVNSKRYQSLGEASTQARDSALEFLTTFLLRSSRDMLTAVYPDEMRKLGEFGFVVTATAHNPKEPSAPAAKPVA